MKTSNKILLVAALCFMAFATVQIIDAYRQVRQVRQMIRPILEQIDSSDIRVIRMVRTNDNYVASNSTKHHKSRRIYFSHCKPDASSLRIEGDTLIVTHEGRVLVHIPSATHVIEWDGSVRELEPQNTATED